MATNEGHKTWTYTLNNWTDAELQRFRDLEGVTYMVIGKEHGEEGSGTHHLQGFITFKTKHRMTALKKIFPRAHFEPAIAADAAANYCMKEDYEIINNRQQGKRNDLAAAVAFSREHGIKRMAAEYSEVFVKFHSGLIKLAQYAKPERNFKPHVTWIWGPTGSNKTRTVREKESDLWISAKDLKWWDGYENQEAVLLDDFRKDFCTFHELLRILDRYPYWVQTKGGGTQLTARRMYITSCYHPAEVYDTREDIGQLTRRIDEIIEMGTLTGAAAFHPPPELTRQTNNYEIFTLDEGDENLIDLTDLWDGPITLD